ncbi:phytoene desaturase family protein [Tuwongella immobilis]|uniref:Amine oxidase domain-containing protein n=1 Tax=Tuwongella immobilis TaxID=692036 RepID=A0A6C2YQZ3_9BACT|nr:phytoene desaturase family protein [Tuwongella immobilis]VIP03824.1 phytoene desaturase : Phytoene desaturase OS=Azospirillum brasilense GN=ABAZ39_01055 PE=4 SV=1: NAD_binding_8 [Tuwongella immobilis]VTS05015.1 phytoene desaturase : Phytoene desaturase OS=Azospirillum brasilense GN=ABAZ39_01055 PE=4 SV=1: NAD_binding_8 [Tuwongella immobilis]
MAAGQRIGVIGSGLGGLAAAATLAARGYQVHLFEKSPWLGGKAAVLEKDGYRFDMGPTILTVPSVLKKIFDDAGRKMEDYLEIIRLDPQWRCFFTDGSVLDLKENVAEMKQTLAQYSPNSGSAEGYERFIQLSKRLHDISDRFFFWKSIGSIMDMLEIKAGFQPKLMADVWSMRPGRSVASTVRSFVPDERVAQMLDHFTQYVGSCPEQSPAVLCGIAHMQTEEGIWYPMGGTRAVPLALAKLASEFGANLRTGVGVTRILTDASEKRVTGVLLDNGETVELDGVVSNMDSVRTHRELMPNSTATRRFDGRRDYEPACSGVVLYLGLKQGYDSLLHHNFVFSQDPHEEFHSIYQNGEPAADPTCYVCAPARSETAVAPPGGEALYILVHTPYLRPHHDWKQMLPTYRQTILNKLKTTAGLTDIEDRIATEGYLTPQDIHDRYRVLNGAIYGLASHGKFLGAFKPANRSKDVKGLYLAGGAAHPGPGMPMVMMSGWIAANSLDEDYRGVAQPDREPVLAS